MNHGTLACVCLLSSCQLIILKLQVLFHLFDQLLFTFPIVLHKHHLLFHLLCVVLQLHVVRLVLYHLILEFTTVLHQELSETYHFLKVLFEVLHLCHCRILHFLRDLALTLLNSALDMSQDSLFGLHILHVRCKHLINEIKVLVQLPN